MTHGKEKFKRKCKNCTTAFVTADERQLYCSRACGNTYRSKRWYKRASAALRKGARMAKAPAAGVDAISA